MKEAQIVATIHRIGEDIIALADYLAAAFRAYCAAWQS